MMIFCKKLQQNREILVFSRFTERRKNDTIFNKSEFLRIRSIFLTKIKNKKQKIIKAIEVNQAVLKWSSLKFLIFQNTTFNFLKNKKLKRFYHQVR